MNKYNATAAFQAWLLTWWKNPTPIDPITRSNVHDAFLAGWKAGRWRGKGQVKW